MSATHDDETTLRLRAILEGALDAVLMVRASGAIESVNPAVERMFGRSAAQLVGRDARELLPRLFAPSEANERDEGAADAREGAGANARTFTRRGLLGVRADGGSFPMDVSVTEATLPSGVLYVVTARDTSEQRAAERLKSEFVATVSHEMRTPLTSIRGALGLLENNVVAELPAEALELVSIARANTERLIRLINDVLDLEKIEAGKMELRRVDTDARDLIDGTLNGLSAFAEQHGVNLRAEVQGSPRVFADRDRLVQVLTNLVSNAVRFSPRATSVRVRAFATVPAATAGDASTARVRFEVHDAGPGIAPELLPRLFQRFEQLSVGGKRVSGGTGLGLAIARRLVEQHGGSIGVESIQGVGSTFWFELSSSSETVATGSQRLAQRRSVLVVEDDAPIASALRAHLGREGYRVVRASSRAEAAARIENDRPDLLVLDVGLPDGDGLELLTITVDPRGAAKLPVVVLSGREPPSPLPQGAFAWIRKPFEPGTLLRSVRHAVRPPGPARVLVADTNSALAEGLRAALEAAGAKVQYARDGRSARAEASAVEPDLVLLDAALRDVDAFELVDGLRQERARTAPLVVSSVTPLGIADRQALVLGETRFVVRSDDDPKPLLDAARVLLGELLANERG